MIKFVAIFQVSAILLFTSAAGVQAGSIEECADKGGPYSSDFDQQIFSTAPKRGKTLPLTDADDDIIKICLEALNDGEGANIFYVVGVLYSKKNNNTAALHFFSRAAQKGHGKASYLLGSRLATGQGGVKDLVLARKYLLAAANDNILAAMIMLTKLNEHEAALLPETEFESRKRLYQDSFIWLERAAKIEPWYYNMLAHRYETGYGIEGLKDVKKALDTRENMVGSIGDLGVLFDLYRHYRYGLGTRANLQKAIRCLTEAAHSGHALSQFELAELYLAGDAGLEPDRHKAKYWMTKAAEQGFQSAIDKLPKISW